MPLKVFPSLIRATLAFCIAVLIFQTSYAESMEEIREEMYRLAENWSHNQEKILQYLTNPDPLKRKYAVEVIPLSDTKSAALKVIPLIDDPDLEVRYGAINRFLDWHLEEAIPPLIDALYSEDKKIKELAVMALVNQGHPSSLNGIDIFVVQTADEEWLGFVLGILDSIGFGNPEIDSRKKEIAGKIRTKLNDN
jgi:HEAT repeat protein